MHRDTRRLVEDAKRGDAAALGELLERHLPGLRAFIRLRSNSVIRARESSSDLAQSVCREVLQNLDRFEYRGEASFRSWLYTWALHKLMKRERYHRAQKRSAGREAAATEPRVLLDRYATFCTPSRQASAREQLERIEAAFDRLPEHYREIIVQARLVGLPHVEIARTMGRSEEAVRQLLKRAVVRLATLVEETEPGPA